MTIQQKLRTPFIFKLQRPSRLTALNGCPQKKGTCLKAYIMTPRKPNSAKRKVTRVVLSNYERITSYVPGITSNLQKHSTVLVRAGRTKDFPDFVIKIYVESTTFILCTIDEMAVQSMERKPLLIVIHVLTPNTFCENNKKTCKKAVCVKNIMQCAIRKILFTLII